VQKQQSACSVLRGMIFSGGRKRNLLMTSCL